MKRKIRIYRLEGKSERFRAAQRDCAEIIEEAKKNFWNKVLEKTATIRNSSEYYRAVNIFKTKESHSAWDIASMYPEKTDSEIAELAAEFFNRISQEYSPIPDPRVIEEISEPEQFLQQFEVSGRLRSFRKPKSRVKGDIAPELITEFHAQLAVPLTYLFNLVLTTLQWPDLWKSETVTIIPKNNSPSSLSELRNLSCTPLFSEVLESFVLDRLKRETRLSMRQYGGVKGCSTEHFLLETWDRIITALEDGKSAAKLVSIDFAKAFNRMDHTECLLALACLGHRIQ